MRSTRAIAASSPYTLRALYRAKSGRAGGFVGAVLGQGSCVSLCLDERMTTPKQMLVGFGVGLIAGLLVYTFTGGSAPWLSWVIDHGTGVIGQLFLRALMMLVLPLVFSALVLAVATMGDAKELVTLGKRMGLFTLLSTGLAVSTGMFLMHVFQPGASFDPILSASLVEGAQGRVNEIVEAGAHAPTGIDILIGIVPTNMVAAAAQNDLLAVLFFSLFFGIGLACTRTKASEALLHGIDGLFDVTMTLIGWVIKTAPVAVACLVFNTVAVFGWAILIKLGGYVGVTLLAMSIHALIFYPLMLWFGARRSPLEFARGSRESLVMAFSTASSSATLPTTLRVAEKELGLPPRITRFVVTVGATANQNGTALFEGVTVLFLAQLAGVDLSFGQQLLMMGICVLGGVGTAGVPAGSLPVIAMICVMFGIDPQGIGIILGVDRFLDMCRTTINVGGDLVASAVLTQWDETSSRES